MSTNSYVHGERAITMISVHLDADVQPTRTVYEHDGQRLGCLSYGGHVSVHGPAVELRRLAAALNELATDVDTADGSYSPGEMP